MLTRLCSEFFKLDFSSEPRTSGYKNKKEPDIKLPASIVSYKNQGNSGKKKKREREKSTSASLTTLKTLCG